MNAQDTVESDERRIGGIKRFGWAVAADDPDEGRRLGQCRIFFKQGYQCGKDCSGIGLDVDQHLQLAAGVRIGMTMVLFDLAGQRFQVIRFQGPAPPEFIAVMSDEQCTVDQEYICFYGAECCVISRPEGSGLFVIVMRMRVGYGIAAIACHQRRREGVVHRRRLNEFCRPYIRLRCLCSKGCGQSKKNGGEKEEQPFFHGRKGKVSPEGNTPFT